MKMSVPADYAFDIQTLLVGSQPKSMLVIGGDGEALGSD
jgi:hypothetical protein